MTSENPVGGGSHPPRTTSENTVACPDGPTPKRRGARPTALSAEYQEILDDYAAVLADVPVSADTRRTYVSRVRMFLAWLAGSDNGQPQRPRRFRGDPLTNPRSRDWVVRDYRVYLLREADPKRSVRYVNNALAALDDFGVRLGMGKADIGREDIPRTAPKAMDSNAQIRWLRAIEDWPHARDRALADPRWPAVVPGAAPCRRSRPRTGRVPRGRSSAPRPRPR